MLLSNPLLGRSSISVQMCFQLVFYIQQLHILHPPSPYTCSELAGILLIDPAPETLFDAGETSRSTATPTDPPEDSGETSEERDTLWSHHWYRKTVPHLQSVHLSGSLGFNRLGLMVGLMSALEVPELKTVLSDDVIAIKVNLL